MMHRPSSVASTPRALPARRRGGVRRAGALFVGLLVLVVAGCMPQTGEGGDTGGAGAGAGGGGGTGPQTTLTGTVVDSNGAALAGATVQLVSSTDSTNMAQTTTDGDGGYAFDVPGGGSFTLHIALAGDTPVDLPASVPPGQQTFADVTSTHPAYSSIEIAADEDLMSGYACGGPGEACDGQSRPYFRPSISISRASALRTLVRGVEGAVAPTTSETFTDVPVGSFAHDEIERAVEEGVASGYACGGPGEPCDGQNRPYFRPGTSVTRGQYAKWLSGELEEVDNPQDDRTFVDVNRDSPYNLGVERLYERGLVDGFACGGPTEPCDKRHRPYFRPFSLLTRSEAADLTTRALGYAENPRASRPASVVVLDGLDLWMGVARLVPSGSSGGSGGGGGGGGTSLDWSSLTPASPPSGRAEAAMATLPGATAADDEIVFFGGVDASNSQYNDTWVFHPSTETWTLALADTATPGSQQPARRQAASMAYDAESGTVVLFGGKVWNGSGYTYMNDTWAWDGSAWTQLQADTTTPGFTQPSQRAEMAMAVDNFTYEPVLFGGTDASGADTNDVWQWDSMSATWLPVIPNDPTSATMPSPRGRAVFALDQNGNTDVLFGGSASGTKLDDTWLWDGLTGTWSLLQADTASPGTTQPSQRYEAALSWDPAAGGLVLFGGNLGRGVYAADTWQFNGTGWTELSPATAPHARASAVMDHEPVGGGGAILFGGYDPDEGWHADTWRFGT